MKSKRYATHYIYTFYILIQLHICTFLSSVTNTRTLGCWVHLELDPQQCTHLQHIWSFNLDDLKSRSLAGSFLYQSLDVAIPPTTVFVKVLAGILIQEAIYDSVPSFTVLQENDASGFGLQG